MSHTAAIWDDPKNVDLLAELHGEGKTFAQIASAIGVTRNAVIGKAKRMKLPPRVERRDEKRRASRTVNGSEGKRGRAGLPGQPKAANILHRIDGRLKAERARQVGKASHAGHMPFRAPGRVDVDDDGVDVTHLVGFADRRINHQCAWVHGDPLEAGSGFCGMPVVPGTQWCEAHHARVYAGRAPL